MVPWTSSNQPCTHLQGSESATYALLPGRPANRAVGAPFFFPAGSRVRRGEAAGKDGAAARDSLLDASGGRATGDIWMELRKARSDLIGGSAEDHGALGAIEAQVRKEIGNDD